MADGIRFIRKNGRVIPVRNKQKHAFSGAHHGKFAAAGAVARATMKAAPKTSTAFAAATGIASLVNAVQHGREKKSFLHGVGRAFSNDLSVLGGRAAAGGAIHVGVHGLRSPGFRKAAKGAGKRFSGKGGYKVMKSPFTGPIKDVSSKTRLLRGE